MTATERLTRRESATLDAVARRLSNSEIAEEFHVSVRTVESHIAALRRKLGADSRSALIAAAQQQRCAMVSVPANSFVGRGADAAAVRVSLDRDRWLTVVGPAGAGKTRLALEVAAVGARSPVVVELEHKTDREVVAAIAKAIGLSGDSSSDLLTQCAVAMSAQPHLLVLDNCDRVLDTVAEAVTRLLAASGTLAVLATSRSPVGGTAESIHVLEPLSVEDRSGAYDLFVDRARTAIPGFTPDDDEAEAVARICRRLDGLPLAIELATARLRHLPLAELETRLEDGFGALDRARPASRHRTLETAFDWTWDLLGDDERSVLSRLSALPRTFDLELAEIVASAGAGGVVLRLLDRSLVASAGGSPARFRLLDALREFVLGRTDPAVVHAVRRAHAEHFASLAGQLAAIARTDDSRVTAEQAAANCTDVNAAAHWALRHDPALAMSIGASLSVGAEQYNPDVDSLSTIALVARDPRVRELATTAELFRFGVALCYWDLGLVSELAGLALGRIVDPTSELQAHHLAGYADAYRDRPEPALEHLEAAERLAIELDDPWELGSVRQGIGIALRDQDADAAIAAFESSMEAYARAGDAMHVNNARYMMAATAAGAGVRSQEATAWAEQCAAYARECGNQHELAHAMLTRATLSPTEPDTSLDDAIEEFRTVGDLRCLTRALLLLATRRPAAEQVPLLRQAHDVAVRAQDLANQAMVLERLVPALWESGARRLAVVELGVLTHLLGEETARGRCPESMLRELDRWDTTIAEGRARGVVQSGP
jgi:predicted ATPase/DNA-binding CsgD family transcriptional regulator